MTGVPIRMLPALIPVPALETGSSLAAVALFGFLTSFHCIGMCGGLVLSQSAEGQPLRQGLLFQAGRILCCTAVGAVLGGVGQLITLNAWLRGLLPVVCAGVMLLSALQLLGLFRWLHLPAPRRQLRQGGAFLTGCLTGLLPCGMLQIVQLHALGTGSLWMGAASMLTFGLSSAPVLCAFGLLAGAWSLRGQKAVRILSALVILYLGLRMLLKGIRMMGGIP